MNLLSNPSFEAGWTTDAYTGNQTPTGWRLTWQLPGATMLSAGAFPGEDLPVVDRVIRVPECVHKLQMQLPEDEWLGAPDALILDGTAVYKVFGVGFSASLTQVLTLPPGMAVKLQVPVQSHHHGDGSRGACAARLRLGAQYGPWVTFRAGLPDPATPAWVTLEISGDVPAGGRLEIGIDLEGRTAAPIDFFIDACVLMATAVVPADEFVAAVELLPPDATLPEEIEVVTRTYADRRTIAHSLDDAVRVVVGGQPGSSVDVWNPERWGLDVAAHLLAAGVPAVRECRLTAPVEPPPPVTPPPGYAPVNRTPQGTKLSFQGAYPVDFTNKLAARGVVLPTFKFVQSIGDIPVTREGHIMARLIDDPRTGENLEGFDYRGDPEQQAEARVAALWPFFAPYAGRLDSIELINEQGMPRDDPDAPVNLARFFLRAMDLLEPRGIAVAWPSASVGTPEPEQWDAMIPTGIFERSAAKGHVLSLHEYGPTLDGPNSTICRYRDLYARILIPRGIDIPCFITEFNVTDDLLNADVLAHWKAYDALVRQDPYVQGVHIFIVGGGQGWDNYHNATVKQFPKFLEYAVAEKDVANGG